MRYSDFHRARRFGSSSPATLAGLYLATLFHVATVATLLVLFWLATELVITRGRVESDARLPRFAAPTAATSDAPSPASPLVDSDLGLQAVARAHGDAWRGRALARACDRLPALRSNQSSLVALAVAAALTALAYALSLAAQRRAAYRAASLVVVQMRHAIFRRACEEDASDLVMSSARGPVGLFTVQVDQLRQSLVSWWRAIPQAPLMLAAVVAVSVQRGVHLVLVLAAVLLALLVWLVTLQIQRPLRRRQAVLTDRADRRVVRLIESLRQVRHMRGLLLTEPPGEPFDESLRRHARDAISSDVNREIQRIVTRCLLVLSTILMIVLLGVNVLHVPPRITLGEAMMLLAACACAQGPLRQLLRLPTLLERGDRAARALFSHLEREPGIGQLPGATQLQKPTSQIVLDNVTFTDRFGHEVIHEATLEIPVGSRVALLSTDPHLPLAMVSLLTRFCDPTLGRILFDDQDIQHVTLDSLRRAVVVIQQEGLLFTGSVTDNITGGDPRFSMADVASAAKKARAYDFVQRLPQQFETTIGEHGIRLDPGESLRIGLARAILRRPWVIAVEEPEGPLEPSSAAAVSAALARVGRNRTLILLPALLESLRSAQQVFLFDGGSLRATGTHVELLQTSELYRHLHYVRFNEFRAARS